MRKCFSYQSVDEKPATRADIIEKLVKDGFVKREKKQMIPTDDGVKLITVLPDEKQPLASVEELVEQNCNMIDGVINNLPPQREEKKERERVSMKVLLAEKIAEVANRGKQTSEAEKESQAMCLG